MIVKNNKKSKLILLSLILSIGILYKVLDSYGVKLNMGNKPINKISIQNTDNSIDAGITNKLNDENNTNVSSESDEVPLSYLDYIKTEGNISKDLISYLDLKLSCIPENLLSSYFNLGGIILITDKDISKTYYSEYNFGNIIGLHDARRNIIYMSNSEYAIDSALIHEFGHVLDSLSDWDSMNQDFLKIFNQEKDSFEVESYDNHYKSNEREFFAEVFQEYILHPAICKSSAPNAFNFVDKKINNLK